ncbi:Peptidase S1C, Do [Rhodoferax ferrireducens T118]|uniref:Probable periplasmic serine endoprotease DegP-like n=1 Tax=Albidiferax ferrireducens (strain ATCC BAA-621 / DSM 15236 / T118) TaxID=338969 RepID=Q21RT2_ALBFT|nr:Do family serine endopeptidase [Rhodoferax ferrireducens]ABD71521.1 Peptidase S1C, Do [Rhodoferax ferrireducens T118]
MNTSLFSPRRLVLALVSVGVLGAAGVGALSFSHAQAAVSTAPTASAAATAPVVALPDFSQIAARNGAAVVNISVTGMINTSGEDNGDGAPHGARPGMPGMDPNDPFFEFFKRFQGPNGGFPGQPRMPMHGQGSGFIISPDGVILTNAHVVRDAKDVTVKLTDRREFRAKVLGTDLKTDVAVLKIDAKDLPTITVGTTRDLKVGEWVLAIGSPFGFENSVTAGVVSAKGRSLPDDSFVPFIQTDVAVNPGNSGGPLFNTRGQVVGINSQIYSQSGGYQGLSFAIPIELASKVKDQIVATGHASHARLGVVIQEVNQTFADSFHLDKPEGALVSNVDKDGPADKAGLKSGDVILKVNGQPIIMSSDLPALIGTAAPGDKVSLEIWRQGKREQFTARLGDASAKVEQLAKADDGVGQGKLGLALRALQPQEKRAAGVNQGLLVEDAAGPAALAGVQAGDVLVAVNGTPIESVTQVRAIVAKATKSVALLIQRDGSKIFVPVRLG